MIGGKLLKMLKKFRFLALCLFTGAYLTISSFRSHPLETVKRETTSIHPEKKDTTSIPPVVLNLGHPTPMGSKSIEVPKSSWRKHHLPILSEDTNITHKYPWNDKEIYTKSCFAKDWYALGPLPKASVVVNFIDNEKWINLLRTTHSIAQNVPEDLLEEIILVGDNCHKEEFHKALDIYMEGTFGDKVRIIRSNVTLGAITSRLRGIQAARGEVVVTLDSHMEVQKLWLEPLLYAVKENRKTLATSFLDWLGNTGSGWTYTHGPSIWKNFFSLNFGFGWHDISDKEKELRKDYKYFPEPVRSSMTIGSAYAIDKAFFTEIGEMDEGQILWGGDNIDLSLRVWLFGGRVVNVPCSKAAHYEVKGQRDYRAKFGNADLRNYKRVIEVWFDDYADTFYEYMNPLIRTTDPGDLSARFAIKKRAIHNISWFFDNVYPELVLPNKHGMAWGNLKNNGTNLCLVNTDYGLNVGDCAAAYPLARHFTWTRAQQEIRREAELAVILTFGSGTMLYRKTVAEMEGTDTVKKWLHWKNGPLMRETDQVCLQASTTSNIVDVKPCDFNNVFQKWSFEHYGNEYEDVIKQANYVKLMSSVAQST